MKPDKAEGIEEKLIDFYIRVKNHDVDDLILILNLLVTIYFFISAFLINTNMLAFMILSVITDIIVVFLSLCILDKLWDMHR